MTCRGLLFCIPALARISNHDQCNTMPDTVQTLDDLAAHARELLVTQGLTQKAAADRLGITREAISQALRPRPRSAGVLLRLLAELTGEHWEALTLYRRR